jgi:hypothetical protein
MYNRLIQLLACTAAASLLGVYVPACAAAPAAEEDVGINASAVLGSTTWDPSCSPDAPELARAFNWGKIAANSPAFASCIETSLTTTNDAGKPPQTFSLGPYVPCQGDPPNTSAGTILSLVRSMNPTNISCNYSLIGTSLAGDALVQNPDNGNSSTSENINLGSVLGQLAGGSGPCYPNTTPPANCNPTVNYAVVADTMFHEIMHQHGYAHVDDNYSDYTAQSSVGHLCGIPYSQQPRYPNSIPYIVGICLYAVMAESDAECSAMYTGCGEGLSLLDSVYSATPTCSCVEAPRRSAVGSPRIGAVSQASVNDYFALDGNRSLVHDRWTPAGGFSGWEVLGGTFISAPVAVAGVHGPGTVDVIAQGTNGGYFHKYFDGTQWVPQAATSWDGLAGSFVGPPTVVSWGQNRMDVFGQGTDGTYYHQAWNGSAWLALETVGGKFNGPPAAVVTQQPSVGSGGSITLVGRGTDNHYYAKTYDGQSFTPSGTSSWQADGPWTYVTDPVLAATPAHLDIFGQGTDMHYYHHSAIGGALESLGAAIYIGAPAAAWQNANTLDVIGQGTDNTYYHMQQLNGVWSPLEATKMRGFGGGTLLVPSPGDLNLIVEGTDHHAYFQDLRGTTWSAVLAIPGGSLD